MKNLVFFYFIFCLGKTSREKEDPTQSSTKVNIYIHEASKSV